MVGRPKGVKNISSKRIKLNKEMFLKEYKQSYNLNKSIEAGTFSRRSFYNYLESDIDFFNAVQDVRDDNLSHVENKLMDCINKGNINAIIFFLRQKGAKNGWLNDNKLEINNIDPIKISYIYPSENK